MALALDAYSESPPRAAGGPLPSWPHTPGADPDRIVAIVVQGNNGGVPSGVTYGGVAMTQMPGSPISVDVALDQTITAWDLSSGIPTGPQTVAVGSGTGDPLIAFAFSLVGDGEIELVSVSTIVAAVATNVYQTTLDLDGRPAFVAYATVVAAAGNLAAITTPAGWTQNHESAPWTGGDASHVVQVSHLTDLSASEAESIIVGPTTDGVNRTGLLYAFAFAEVASEGVSGTLAVTEPADAASASGEVEIAGALAVTEPADTFAAEASVLIAGAFASTEPSDSASVSGEVEIAGALTATEPADVAGIAGEIEISGALSATEQTDSASVNGSLIISGALVATEPTDTFAAQGTGGGTMSVTESPDAFAASGEVLIAGDVAATEPADVAGIAGGVLIEGSLSVAEALDVAAISGDVTITGALVVVEPADAAAISGELASNYLRVVEPSDVFAAAGELDLGADIAITEAPDVAQIIGRLTPIYTPSRVRHAYVTREAARFGTSIDQVETRTVRVKDESYEVTFAKQIDELDT